MFVICEKHKNVFYSGDIHLLLLLMFSFFHSGEGVTLKKQ